MLDMFRQRYTSITIVTRKLARCVASRRPSAHCTAPLVRSFRHRRRNHRPRLVHHIVRITRRTVRVYAIHGRVHDNAHSARLNAALAATLHQLTCAKQRDGDDARLRLDCRAECALLERIHVARDGARSLWEEEHGRAIFETFDARRQYLELASCVCALQSNVSGEEHAPSDDGYEEYGRLADKLEWPSQREEAEYVEKALVVGDVDAPLVRLW
mmetsp:Transcript_13552/g.35986  ORF Transcript_13552/g.35986 Transcript_13552/m.35986 type:complete len:214 (-) Transcript_13552:721-1362(-)